LCHNHFNKLLCLKQQSSKTKSKARDTNQIQNNFRKTEKQKDIYLLSLPILIY
jgi:hypothetical protein